MKSLWFFLIPISLWLMAIFHRIFDIEIINRWYSFPLIVTYLLVLIIVIVFCIKKLEE